MIRPSTLAFASVVASSLFAAPRAAHASKGGAGGAALQIIAFDLAFPFGATGVTKVRSDFAINSTLIGGMQFLVAGAISTTCFAETECRANNRGLAIGAGAVGLYGAVQLAWGLSHLGDRRFAWVPPKTTIVARTNDVPSLVALTPSSNTLGMRFAF
jgi:hypothetical protein